MFALRVPVRRPMRDGPRQDCAAQRARESKRKLERDADKRRRRRNLDLISSTAMAAWRTAEACKASRDHQVGSPTNPSCGGGEHWPLPPTAEPPHSPPLCVCVFRNACHRSRGHEQGPEAHALGRLRTRRCGRQGVLFLL